MSHRDLEGLVGHRDLEGFGGLTGLVGLTDLVGLAGLGDPGWQLVPVGPGALVDFGPLE